MRKVLVVDGQTNVAKEGYILEESDVKSEADEKKANLKEHVYILYLIIGTLAFSLTIYAAVRKLKK